MNRIIFFIVFIFSISTSGYAQKNVSFAEKAPSNYSGKDNPACGQTIADQEFKMKFKGMEDAEEVMNQKIHQSLFSKAGQKAISNCNSANQTETIEVPTVIHLVHYSTSALGTGANMTDHVVDSLIGEVNNYFSHSSGLTFSNPHSGVDTKIKLVLAKRDVNNNLTNGIIRHSDDSLAMNNMSNQGTQKTYRWDPTRYLNIYIPEGISNSANYPNQIYVAGYAYLPTSHGRDNDGVLAHAKWITPYVLTHELGHYFGLYHTFQGCYNSDCSSSGDRVCDTPPKATSKMGTGTCENPTNSCFTDTTDLDPRNPFRPLSQGGLGDMHDGFENYMDYTGYCGKAFTQGQADRMRHFLFSIRTSLLQSNAIDAITNNDGGVTSIASPSTEFCSAQASPIVTIKNYGNSILTSCNIIIEADGDTILNYPWTGSLGTNSKIQVTLPQVSLPLYSHELVTYVALPNGQPDENNRNDAWPQCMNFIPSLKTTEIGADMEDGLFPKNWGITNPDGFISLKYFDLVSCPNENGNGVLKYPGFGFVPKGPGVSDYLHTEIIDLRNSVEPYLTFDLAYKQAVGLDGMQLKVKISTECGNVSTTIFSDSSASLSSTNGKTNSSWAPSNCSQWKTTELDLSSFNGQVINVIFQLTIMGTGGEDFYLDNIFILDSLAPVEPEFNLNLTVGQMSSTLDWDLPSAPVFQNVSLLKRPHLTGGEINLGISSPLISGPNTYLDRIRKLQEVDYFIKATDLNGTEYFSDTVTASKMDLMNGDYLILPSPATSFITIHIGNPLLYGSGYNIVNTGGRRVSLGVLNSGKDTQINITALRPGTYIFQSTVSGVKSTDFVVEARIKDTSTMPSKRTKRKNR